MNQETKKPASLPEKVQQIQFMIAGILGSTGLTFWISTFDFIAKRFPGKRAETLLNIQDCIIAFGLAMSCLVGLRAWSWLLDKGGEIKKNLTQPTELINDTNEK